VLGNGMGPVSAPDGQSDYGHGYPSLQFATDVILSESTCSFSTVSGCTVPPPGAVFYPFYAQSGSGKQCLFTFGNDIRGATVNDFGCDAQYGTTNIIWLSNSGGIRPNPCTPH
jgi:hypothetical protein